MQEADLTIRGHVPAPPVEEIFVDHKTLGYPYLDLVPKDLGQNLEFRKSILLAAAKNPDLQGALKEKCRGDLLFWVNTFVWIIEPRTREVRPFITYPFQDKALLAIQESLGHHDLVIVKSRDQGGTWMVMAVFTYEWQFFDHSEFQLTSRIESDVDTRGDYSSLLPKADFILENQPTWLAPSPEDYSRKENNLQNHTNASMFRGYATTPQSGRGARRRGTLYDEFAMVEPSVGTATLATSQAVGTRIWCSTPYGPTGAFASKAHDKNVKRIDLDWSEHPEKNPGLYTSVDGFLQVLDPNVDFEVYDCRVSNYKTKDGHIVDWPSGQRGSPPGYKFILDGTRRSPYFDYECRRMGNPQHVAQEMNRDFLRSGAQFFNQAVLDNIRPRCRAPEYIGEFTYDIDSGSLKIDKEGKRVGPLDAEGDEHPNGNLRLWSNLREPYADAAESDRRDLSVEPRDITSGTVEPDAEYVVGADIAVGSGASCSAIAILDCHTGEQVGEYANPHIAPHEFAPLVKAIATWLNDALVIWDSGGSTGAMFRKAFLPLGYTNYWMRRAEDKLSKTVSDTPGWFGKGERKAEMLDGLGTGWANTTLRTYSDRVLNEAAEYVWHNGAPEHSSVPGTKDPTEAGAQHGDRVIALGLAWFAAPDISITAEKPRPKIMPGSLAYRRQEAERVKPDEYPRIRGELVV